MKTKWAKFIQFVLMLFGKRGQEAKKICQRAAILYDK